MQTNTPATKLPYSATKKQLVKMCYPMPEQTVLDRINIIIIDNRKNRPECQGKNSKQIKSTKTVEHSELKEYFETFGLPPGLEI